MRGGRLRGDDHRAHVHCEGCVNILQRQRLERPASVDPGIVDEDIDATKGLYRPIHRLRHRGGISAAGLQGKPAAAMAFDRGDDRARLFRGTLVGNGDIGTVGRQALGDRCADPAACPGDQRSLSLQ